MDGSRPCQSQWATELNRIRTQGHAVTISSITTALLDNYIECQIWNQRCFMLVDSGSNISVIYRSAILKFGWARMSSSDELTHIQVANKQNIEIVGLIKTTVQVQGHNLTAKLYVVDNLHTDFILGGETLRSWSAAVEFQQNCLRINGGKRSLVCDISTAIPPIILTKSS